MRDTGQTFIEITTYVCLCAGVCVCACNQVAESERKMDIDVKAGVYGFLCVSDLLNERGVCIDVHTNHNLFLRMCVCVFVCA